LRNSRARVHLCLRSSTLTPANDLRRGCWTTPRQDPSIGTSWSVECREGDEVGTRLDKIARWYAQYSWRSVRAGHFDQCACSPRPCRESPPARKPPPPTPARLLHQHAKLTPVRAPPAPEPARRSRPCPTRRW